MPKRKSKFDTHPDGQQILQDILNDKLSITEAAKILCCTKSNISQYLKRHNLHVQRTSEPVFKKVQSSPPTTSSPSNSPPINLTKSPLKSTALPPKPDVPLNEMAEQTISLTEGQLEYISPKDMMTMQQDLIHRSKKGEIAITIPEFTKLCHEIRLNFELQLKYDLANRKDEQIVKLNDTDVKAILEKIDDYCGTCEYRKYFNEKKNTKQTKARLASE